MRNILLLITILALLACTISASAFTVELEDNALTVSNEGSPWLVTHVTPFDPAKRVETYKVFSEIYNFAGDDFVTKGIGEKFTHQRGMFVGWINTKVIDGENVYKCDSWHMKNCYQEHVRWLELLPKDDYALQSQEINWDLDDGKTFIRETRTIKCVPGPNEHVRIFDFMTTLVTDMDKVELRGDSKHSGMNVRMSNEIIGKEDDTKFIWPEGASENDKDEVAGGWWLCCHAELGGKRWYVLHMTPKNHPTGQPIYSTRPYGKPGAVFPLDLLEDQPVSMQFRIIVTDETMTREKCQAFYDDYEKETDSCGDSN